MYLPWNKFVHDQNDKVAYAATCNFIYQMRLLEGRDLFLSISYNSNKDHNNLNDRIFWKAQPSLKNDLGQWEERNFGFITQKANAANEDWSNWKQEKGISVPAFIPVFFWGEKKKKNCYSFNNIYHLGQSWFSGQDIIKTKQKFKFNINNLKNVIQNFSKSLI